MQDVTENLIKDLRRFGAQMLNDCEEALTLTEEQLHAIRFVTMGSILLELDP